MIGVPGRCSSHVRPDLLRQIDFHINDRFATGWLEDEDPRIGRNLAAARAPRPFPVVSARDMLVRS
jgi:hypothetical protein